MRPIRLWVIALLLQAGVDVAGARAAEDTLGDPLPVGALQRLGTLQLRYGSIGDLAYLPGGRAVVASGPTLDVWDFASGQRVFQGRVGRSSIRGLDVRDGGPVLLVADTANNVHEWDADRNEILRTLATRQSGLVSACYAPDRTRILTTGASPPTLKEFDLATGSELVSIRGNMHSFSHGAYGPAGKTAFAGGPAGSDAVLAHYDLATGELLKEWHKDYSNYGRSPLLSPDEERVLAGTRHMAVEFQIDGYRLLNRFQGHHGHAVTAIAYTASPDQILTGSRDGSIRLWDRQENKVLSRWVAHAGHCTHLRVSPDGKRVLSFGGGMVVESDLATGQPTIHWERHTQDVHAVAMMPDGQRVVSGSSDATLRIWDLASGRSRAVIEGANLGAHAVAVAPDGSKLAVGCKDGVVREFSTADGSLVRERTGHLGYVRSVAYAPDGRQLVSSADDGRIRLWTADSDQEAQNLDEHLGGVLAVAVSADGERILSGGRDGTVRLWDLRTAQRLRTFTGHRGWVETVCFEPDGRHAFSSGRDGRILKWDLDSGEIQAEFVHGGWVQAIACAPDGKTLCAGGQDYVVSCWDIERGERLATFRGHRSHVLGLAIAPDGRHVVSASADTTLLVWEIPSGKPSP